MKNGEIVGNVMLMIVLVVIDVNIMVVINVSTWFFYW